MSERICSEIGCERVARFQRNFCNSCSCKKHRAAKKNEAAAHGLDHDIPHGYIVNASTTQLNSAGEIERQWLKVKREDEDQLKIFEDLLAHYTPIISPVVPLPRLNLDHTDDYLSVIPMGDPHVGMYAWGLECGQDFNLEIAQRDLCTAADHLIAVSPPSRKCLLINLGDFFHADNLRGMTERSGHHLDTDKKLLQVWLCGMSIMQYVIDRALQKFEEVEVWCVNGNHDEKGALALMVNLMAWYRNEPRVEVKFEASKHFYLQFGKNLIASTHGDKNMKRLPGVMSVDRAEAWGQTKNRRWYVGHVHHESAEEYPGVVVETFRTLAPKDSYAAAEGYRSGQDMRLHVWHKEWGLINQHRVGIRQVWHLQKEPNV